MDALPASVFNSLYGNEANANFDDGSANGWAMDGLWHISSVRSASPSNSAWYGDEGTGDINVPANTRNFGSMQRSVDLTNVSTLDFDYHLITEWGLGGSGCCDQFSVGVSTDSGTTWTMIADQTTTPSLVDNNDGSGTFTSVSLDVSAYTGQTVNIRFFFDTIDNINNAFQGVFVDNILFQ
ncbi:MAG: immune inhibitor A [SAR324 cluster bacterium]|nr:immune inhibitor A [SAR324 cluster bacterium]